MKSKTPLVILASAILGCLPALAQEPPPSAPPPPPVPGGPQLAPPRGDQPPPPPRADQTPRGNEPRPEAAPPDAGPAGGPRPERGPHGGPSSGEPRPGPGRGEPGLRAPGAPGSERGAEGRPPREAGGMMRPGGSRGPEGAGEGRPPQAPREPQPFLGVSAAPLPPPLAAQLGLPEGFGLLVADVLPDSPAGKAGVQRFDVLRLFDDQQLVDPAQLVTLVRGAGKGKEVTLTVIRQAQEQKIAVTVGEHTAEEGPGRLGFDPQALHERFRELEERGRDLSERGRELQERMRDRLPEPPSPDGGPREARPPRPAPPAPRPPGEPGPGAAVPPEELLREARPEGGGRIRLYGDRAVTTLNASEARLRMKDQDGEIEVYAENGRRMLTARDPRGEVVFTGPVETEEQRTAVPETYRNKLSRIHLHTETAPAAF